MVYQLVAHLMQEGPSTDLATRLTAVKAMGKCDTWEFDTEAFLPVLDTTMRELSNLLVQVELPETQANVNRVLGIVITRVGRHVSRQNLLLFAIWQLLMRLLFAGVPVSRSAAFNPAGSVDRCRS